jgi:Fe-S-cluster containining protein
MNPRKDSSPFSPLKENAFTFGCHKGIECFTECCAALKLVLTPYDILRIKHRLNLSSHEFLERFTETSVNHNQRFPMVTLKMREDETRTCPFVTPDGCTIYEDRPGACRLYPVGRAALKVEMESHAREKFFIVREEHCLGFQESKEWTMETWMANEGLEEYNAMNDRWLEIISSTRSLGPQKEVSRKIQMFFMASYNLDRFREFVFKSRFFELFDVPSGLNDRLASEDAALMQFAFEWLKFSLFGEKTLRIKTRPQ